MTRKATGSAPPKLGTTPETSAPRCTCAQPPSGPWRWLLRQIVLMKNSPNKWCCQQKTRTDRNSKESTVSIQYRCTRVSLSELHAAAGVAVAFGDRGFSCRGKLLLFRTAYPGDMISILELLHTQEAKGERS